MKKTRLHYALALVFGVTAGAAVHAASFDLNRLFDAAKGVATATTDIDEKQEIAIGRDVAGTLLGAAPLVNDPALQSYVNKVGRWIASQSERPDLPWHFGVIETAGVNAFAAPGGYILITRGLYEVLENESQLAGVLGHEIAHVIKRHHITVMQKQGWVQAGASAVGGVTGGSATGNLVRNAATNLVSEVFTKGLDKSAEYEADHIGVVLAARAGYNPYGLVDVMQKLQARAGDASLGLLFSTHPHPTERLANLGDVMTPRMASLPDGLQPEIRAVSAKAPPARRGRVAAPAGARGMQQEQAPAAVTQEPAQSGGGSGLGLDPGNLLRGLMGR